MKQVFFVIGHGSDNWHKGVPGLQEWEFNNDVMIRAAAIVTMKSEVEVLFPQPKNSITTKLSDRVKFMDKYDPSIPGISCHADASDNPDASGHWGFYWGTSKNGKKLAEIWRRHAKKLPNKDRGLIPCKKNHWTNFFIVRKPAQPMLLIEHAFMTNAEDLKLLKSDKFRDQCATAIAETVFEWYDLDFEKPDYEAMYFELKEKFDKIASIMKGK